MLCFHWDGTLWLIQKSLYICASDCAYSGFADTVCTLRTSAGVIGLEGSSGGLDCYTAPGILTCEFMFGFLCVVLLKILCIQGPLRACLHSSIFCDLDCTITCSFSIVRLILLY